MNSTGEERRRSEGQSLRSRVMTRPGVSFHELNKPLPDVEHNNKSRNVFFHQPDSDETFHAGLFPGELKADINQTLEAFEHVLLLYKSGLHLDNLPPSIIGGKRAWNDAFSSSEVTFLLWERMLDPLLDESRSRLIGRLSTGLLGSWNERTGRTKRD